MLARSDKIPSSPLEWMILYDKSYIIVTAIWIGNIYSKFSKDSYTLLKQMLEGS